MATESYQTQTSLLNKREEIKFEVGISIIVVFLKGYGPISSDSA